MGTVPLYVGQSSSGEREEEGGEKADGLAFLSVKGDQVRMYL